MTNPWLGLLAGSAISRGQQLVEAARLAEIARDLRDGFVEFDEKVARIEELERRVAEAEQRLDAVAPQDDRRPDAASTPDELS